MPDKCANCEHVFPEEEPRVPCPICGETARVAERTAQDEAETREGQRIKQKREGYKGRRPLFESKMREKLSKHGRRAREYLAYDRSDPEKTVKTHRVEEQQANGTWEVVHPESVEYPAKHRPPRRKGK